jgi:hypothetical protein
MLHSERRRVAGGVAICTREEKQQQNSREVRKGGEGPDIYVSSLCKQQKVHSERKGTDDDDDHNYRFNLRCRCDTQNDGYSCSPENHLLLHFCFLGFLLCMLMEYYCLNGCTVSLAGRVRILFPNEKGCVCFPRGELFLGCVNTHWSVLLDLMEKKTVEVRV